MQRLRQLALVKRPGARRGRCSQMYAGATDVKTGLRLREFVLPGQINTRTFFQGQSGTPVITTMCFFAGGAGNPPRTLREGWQYVDSCSTRRVIHKNRPWRSFDSPRSERVTIKQSPQSHSPGMHRAVDNCEVPVETFAQNALSAQVKAVQIFTHSYPQAARTLWTTLAAKVSTPVDNTVEQQVAARRAGERSCGLHM